MRRRGPGDTPPPPPPGAPASRPAQALRQGAEGGGRGDDPGRGGALNAWAQLRWRGEVPGAAAASGEPARAPAASRSHTAEALLVPRRGPSAGGPTHSPPPPPPPLGRGRSQREERPRAGRPAAGRGPQGPGGLSEVRGCLALSAREGRRPAGPLLSPQAGGGTDSLSLPPSLSLSEP